MFVVFELWFVDCGEFVFELVVYDVDCDMFV